MPVELADKHIPYDPEAEKAILGSILIDPETYYQAIPLIQGEDFYIHRHRFIWEAVNRLQERGSPLDFLTLCEELDQAGRLPEIGGSAYLSELINQVPTSLHVEAYAQIIRQSAVRRRILDAATKVAQLANAEDIPLENVIDETEKAIRAASDQWQAHSLQPFSQVLDKLYTQLEQSLDEPGVSGVLTGFIELDKLLLGLQPSDLVVIAGRPGTGKTSFLLSVARYAARMQGKHIVFFTLETGREQLALRLLSQETGIEMQRLRSGDLADDEWQRLTRSTESLKRLQLFLDDTPAISLHQVRSVCRRLQLEGRLDLVVVDYLQLVSAGEHFENRVQEVSFLSRQFKLLAHELNVPVLVAAQLSRAVEQRADKRPVLSDLRESGSIEMDADVVMFIYHLDDLKSSCQVDLMVAKQRNGPTGSVRLLFEKRFGMFQDIQKEGGS
jgi:replicative DNA helicase